MALRIPERYLIAILLSRVPIVAAQSESGGFLVGLAIPIVLAIAVICCCIRNSEDRDDIAHAERAQKGAANSNSKSQGNSQGKSHGKSPGKRQGGTSFSLGISGDALGVLDVTSWMDWGSSSSPADIERPTQVSPPPSDWALEASAERERTNADQKVPSTVPPKKAAGKHASQDDKSNDAKEVTA